MALQKKKHNRTGQLRPKLPFLLFIISLVGPRSSDFT